MKASIVKGIALAALVFPLEIQPAAAAWTAANTSFGQNVVVGATYADLSYTVRTTRVSQSAKTVIVIRNNDPSTPIQINSADFHNSYGVFQKALLAAPLTLNPLASYRIETHPNTLGFNPYPRMESNCSVVVQWEAETAVAAPTIGSAVFISRPDGTGAMFLTAHELGVRVTAERVP